MKRALALVLAMLMAATMILTGCGASGGEERVVNVCSWGEYIDESLIDEFEDQTGITVNYQTAESNEALYSLLKTGAGDYDVIVPSDYMIARLIDEDMLAELDYSNIPNYENIDETFRGLYYDPDNLYTVPYAYGIVGIIYNANEVDEADAEGWDLMWNEKYAGRILQFNNPRDAFGTAVYKLGQDVNSTDRADWDRAAEELKAQKPLRYGLVMDEIFNLMESGEAAIGAYYAGDYFTMLDAQAEDVDLRFYYPEPTNAYIDAMCIPSCAQNKELAERFIDYMLSEEPAIANAEYTYYASPNRVVFESEDYREEMGEEVMEILYPESGDFAADYNAYAYRNLDAATLDYINTLWESIKIG